MTTEQLRLKIKELTQLNKSLEELAYIDKQTGCWNRNWLTKSQASLKTAHSTCLVIIVDINGLKQINDKQGHAEGDKYISSVVAKIKSTFSKVDNAQLVRLGGDEFAIFLPSISFSSAEQYYPILEKSLSNFASIGGYFASSNETLSQAMKLADKEMYKNKNKFYKNK